MGTDTFTYNGLGLRVGKTDSTGTYSYACDGTTPGSPVLSDGHAVYTPGLSENRGGVSRYFDFDKIGNLWTVDGAGKSQLNYEDVSGFGTATAVRGSEPTPFQFSGGNGCQTDADTGLVLMGHRYYDSRLGRFISQDPAGDGDNWYAYADNSPTNEIDPGGLVAQGGGFGFPGFSPDPSMAGIPFDGDDTTDDYNNGVPGTYNRYVNGKYIGTATIGPSLWDQMNHGGGGTFVNFFSFRGFTHGEVQKIKRLIKIINKTPVGHAIVSKATNSKINYKIIKQKGMAHGDGRTGATYFDLTWHTWVDTVDGGREASSLRILAHEFGHSILGYSDSYDPENSDPYNQMMNVDRVENPIMTSLDGPGAARTSY